MIKSEKQMEVEVREKMRGGAGNVEIMHVFKTAEMKGKVRLFARLRIKKGCSIGYHIHEAEEEVFYIISGSGVVTEDGTRTPVGPGDAILTGGGAGHAIENSGQEPLELLAVILVY